ncbi:GNAT family N-acetyltransferase [Actinoplanes siamensis]|nr:GNAT family N-acetyltransferase [Actinoplanes siamensis]
MLRPWDPRDAGQLRPPLDDPAVRRSTSPLPPHAWIASQTAEGRHAFAVLRDGAIAGHVVLKRPRPGQWEVGYWTAAHARRQGVAGWAVEQITGWAFARFAMASIALIHDVDNLASCAVARHCGYLLDAELPPHPSYPQPGHRHVRHRA